VDHQAIRRTKTLNRAPSDNSRIGLSCGLLIAFLMVPLRPTAILCCPNATLERWDTLFDDPTDGFFVNMAVRRNRRKRDPNSLDADALDHSFGHAIPVVHLFDRLKRRRSAVFTATPQTVDHDRYASALMGHIPEYGRFSAVPTESAAAKDAAARPFAARRRIDDDREPSSR
jgi:hypothetical protein